MESYNFRDFDNIEQESPVLSTELGVMTMYDSDELLEQLRGYKFPEYFEPLPSQQEADEYFNWHSRVLAQELKEFTGEDDEIGMGNE